MRVSVQPVRQYNFRFGAGEKEMKQVLIAVLSVALMGVSLGVAADNHELMEFKKAIRALYDLKEKAFADDDPEPILTRFYAPDVISTGPDGFTHAGTEGIRPIYNEVVPTGEVKIESFNTYVSGDAGWDWVNFHVKPDDPKEEPFTFKMLFLWAKVDGKWMSKGEMYVMGAFDGPIQMGH